MYKILLLLVLLSSSILYSKDDKRCSLVTQTSDTDTSCLDLETLDGSVIAVSENTTRFEKESIVLCPLKKETQGKPPAILFILDQSNSMSGAKGIPEGDPDGKRASAIITSLDSLNSKYKQGIESLTGYVEFGSNAPQNNAREILISNEKNITELKTKITLKEMYYTNYISALELGKTFLNSIDTAEYNRYVFFITDGIPRAGNTICQPKDRIIPLLFEKDGETPLAEFHMFFLGNSEPSRPEECRLLDENYYDGFMNEMADTTGGSYNQIKDRRGTNISDKILEVISYIEEKQRAELESVVLQNVSGYGLQSTRLDSKDVVSNDNVLLTFDNELPLDTGNNDITLTVEYNDASFSQEVSFTIAVKSGKYSTSLSDDHFDVLCNERSMVTVVDEEGTAVTTVKRSDDGLWGQLETSNENLNDIEFEWNTNKGKDSEMSVQTGSDRKGERVQFTTAVDLLFTQETIRSKNSVVEIKEDTELSFFWQHPNDPRDFAQETVSIGEYFTGISLVLDSKSMAQVSISIDDDGIEDSTVAVSISFPEGGAIEVTAIEDASGLFTTHVDLSEYVTEYTDDAVEIVGTFIDSRDTEQKDSLLVPVSLVPKPEIAAIYDTDGDGSADSIHVFYFEDSPERQSVSSVTIVWNSPDDSLYQTVRQNSRHQDFGFSFSDYFAATKTNGYNSDGTGTLEMCGEFENESFCQTVPLVDSIGPIVVSAWMVEDRSLLRLVMSEPLVRTEGRDFIIRSRDEYIPDVFHVETDPSHTLEWFIRLTEDSLFFNDSIRLAYRDGAAFVDGVGNRAHEKNPAVPIQFDVTGNSQLNVAWEKPFITFDGEEMRDVISDRDAQDSKGFRTTVMDPSTMNEYLLVEGDEDNDGEFYRTENRHVGPTIVLDIDVPTFNDYLPEELRLIENTIGGDNVPKWEVYIEVQVYFYDQLGQFITSKSQHIQLKDASFFNELNQTKLFLEWLPQLENDALILKTDKNTAVATGVIISQVNYSLRAQLIEDYYDFKEGHQLVTKQSQYLKFGYVREASQ
ncbi:MAG: VWA domain-containing protein [Fibrobacterales bacterium]